jgi:preprotein translocase subunit SecG
MLYGILLSFYILVCFLIILLVLVQKGKSSLGLGTMGGGTQLLFGASGGQDIFQKTTWVLCFLLMFGSLGLALMKSSSLYTTRYLPQITDTRLIPQTTAPATPAPETIPAQEENVSQSA